MTNPSVGAPELRGKVALVGSRPPLAPGTCIMCGCGDRQEGFADIGVDLEFFGVIYFCATCAVEIAEAFGAAGPKAAEELRDEVVILSNDNERLRLELTHARADIFGLKRAVASRYANYDDSDSNGNEQLLPERVIEAGEVQSVVDRNDDEVISGGEGEGTESPESVNVEGPNDDSGPQRSNLSDFGI